MIIGIKLAVDGSDTEPVFSLVTNIPFIQNFPNGLLYRVVMELDTFFVYLLRAGKWCFPAFRFPRTVYIGTTT